MSELKAIDDLYERRIRNGSDPYKIKLVDVRHPPVYLKSEADKVIAHNKYKRCLAMWLYMRECYWRCKNHNEQTRADWYNKWMNVFQKLAEKFKEGK